MWPTNKTQPVYRNIKNNTSQNETKDLKELLLMYAIYSKSKGYYKYNKARN